MPEVDPQLEPLVAAVRESAKYRHVCEELIRSLGARELSKRRSLKEAIKATKNVLHQVGGAYQTGAINYSSALAELQEAVHGADPSVWRQACARIMGHHASTRERLPILDRFYAATLADLAPIRSVLDLACGLNPLSIPWMPLAEGAAYYACDIYGDMIDFLNQYVALARIAGSAQTTDVTRACPNQRVDVALLLKSLPCLEQIESGVGLRLLDSLQADHVLVSFPARSLGGRNRGMVNNYETWFLDLIACKNWDVRWSHFPSETVFLISK